MAQRPHHTQHEHKATDGSTHPPPAPGRPQPKGAAAPARNKGNLTVAQGGGSKLPANNRTRNSASPVKPQPTPAQALAQIEAQGGKVRYDEKSPGRPVVAIDFSGKQLNDAGLQNVSGLATLKSLNLKNTQITGSGLANLKNLPHLRVLYLDGTRISNNDLRHLQNLTALEEVYLHNTRVNGVGANALKKVMPKLKVVH